MSEKRVLTIERAKWRRGGEAFNQTHGSTALLNNKGLMCCLGFDALACGLTPGQIRGFGEPVDVLNKSRPVGYASRRITNGVNSQLVWKAMAHNDDPDLTDEAREKLIRKDLMKLGWDDVVFV